MIDYLKAVLARAAAVAAILFGGALAFVLAAITLVAGLLIGLFVTVAAWFGLRSGRGLAGGSPGQRSAGPPSGGQADGPVIDVEMREIEPHGAGQPDTPASKDRPPEP